MSCYGTASPVLRALWDAIDVSQRPEPLWRAWEGVARMERSGAPTADCVSALVAVAADAPSFAYMDSRDARRLRRVARLYAPRAAA